MYGVQYIDNKTRTENMINLKTGCRTLLCSMGLLICTTVYSEDAALSFTELETHLLTAGAVSLDFHATAEGAVETDLRGHLSITASGDITLAAAGHFAGQPTALSLVADATKLSFGNATSVKSTSRPPALAEALLVGLTRMGILHNLAMLSAGQAPDHAGGGVQQWVVVDDFSYAGDGPGEPISFAITVAGQPSGNATLQTGEDGLPLLRRQSVKFPNGEMHVTESYTNFVVTPALK